MEDISLHSIRRKWIFRNQITIKILTVIGFAGVAISFSFNDPMIVFYLSPLLIISIAYFASFIKLRKNPWFKLFALVIVWTTATAVVPILLVSDTFFSTENMLHILVRFCFMMAICIPFDIRDLKIDKADDVSTLPHVIGEGGSRWVAIMFMFAYILLIFPEYKLEMFTATVFYALLLSALINTVLVFMSSSRRSEYFYVAGLDGTMILQGVLLLIASAETF